MTYILNVIGAVTCLAMIIAGVLLSVTKSLFWILMLLALLVLAGCVSLCRLLLQNVEIHSDSQSIPPDSTQR